MTIKDFIDSLKKKQDPEKGVIFPDVKGNIDMANHVLGGTGSVPGTADATGTAMGEGLENLTEELPDLADDAIIDQEDVGISSLFIDVINECWEMVDSYNSIIVTLDQLGRHEFDETLQEIVENKSQEIGSLQAILEILNGSATAIDQGKTAAQDSIAFDHVEEDMLTEAREPAVTDYDEIDAMIDDIISGNKDVTRWVGTKDFVSAAKKLKERKSRGSMTNVPAIRDPKKYVLYSCAASAIDDDKLLAALQSNSVYSSRAKRIPDLFDYLHNSQEWKAAVNSLTNSGMLESKRRTYEQLSLSTLTLTEGLAVNGSLQEFSAQALVDKAFENKMTTHSVREYNGKELYINVDPGYTFGVNIGRNPAVDVIEIDGDTQSRIFMTSASTPEELVVALDDWKNDYLGQ